MDFYCFFSFVMLILALFFPHLAWTSYFPKDLQRLCVDNGSCSHILIKQYSWSLFFILDKVSIYITLGSLEKRMIKWCIKTIVRKWLLKASSRRLEANVRREVWDWNAPFMLDARRYYYMTWTRVIHPCTKLSFT